VSSARLIRVEGEGSGPPSFLHGSPSDSAGSTLVHSMHWGASGEFPSAQELIRKSERDRRLTLQHKKADYINKSCRNRLSDMAPTDSFIDRSAVSQTNNGKVRFNEKVVVKEISCRNSTEVSKDHIDQLGSEAM